jgi:4-amino-4-deoxy-L-arabinose transferase-like glycosyltransferase
LYHFTKKELYLLGGLAALLVPAVLINTGLPQLYGEEPRRAVVALEMLLRNNWIVPTINGESYFLKPPFFNWILASIYHITGDLSEFNTRIITIVSFITFGFVIFFTGRKYVSLTFGLLSSLLFMTAAGNLFFNSLLAEIDMFYSLVTYSGLICLFHFQRQKQYYLLFLTVYLLGAIGVLTKGAPSLVFTGLSLLVFFIVMKEFRKLFSLAHLTGILLFLGITGGYFYAYSRQGDVLQYLLSLSVESGKRFSGETFRDYLLHIVLYPLDTLMNLLPASVLIIFTFRRSFPEIIRGNSLIKFALLMVVVHFPVYWLPPGSKQRYILMLYPFMIQIMTYFFLVYLPGKKMQARLVRYAILALFAMAAFRLAFNLTVLPARAILGVAPQNQQAAFDILETGKGRQVYIYKSTYLPMQTIFYFERERTEIMPVAHAPVHGEIHIVEKILLQEYQIYRDLTELAQHSARPVAVPGEHIPPDELTWMEYEVVSEPVIQKRKYVLLIPARPHP